MVSSLSSVESKDKQQKGLWFTGEGLEFMRKSDLMLNNKKKPSDKLANKKKTLVERCEVDWR